MPNISLDDIFTLLIIVFTLVSVVSGAGRSVSKAQGEARRSAEAERRRRLLEAEAREADPEQQSYQGYLRRTAVPDTDPFGKVVADTGQQATLDDQEALRRAMAEKMGRPLPQAGPSLADDRRQAQAGGPRPAPRPQARPAPAPSRAQTRSLEAAPTRPTSLEVMTSEVGPSLDARPELNTERQAERLRREAEAVRAARDANLDRAAGGQPPATRGQRTVAPGGKEPVIRDTSPFSSRDIVRAFVLSEILGPPRSRHGRERR